MQIMKTTHVRTQTGSVYEIDAANNRIRLLYTKGVTRSHVPYAPDWRVYENIRYSKGCSMWIFWPSTDKKPEDPMYNQSTVTTAIQEIW